MFARLHLATLIAGLMVASAASAEMPLLPATTAEPLIEANAGTIAVPVVVHAIVADPASGASDQGGSATQQAGARSAVATPAIAEQADPVPSSALLDRRLSSRAASAEPSVAPPGGLAALVARFRASSVASRELECLAGAIYFESKSEPLIGQLAVGQVVANRSKSGRFPTSYCGVVFQRGQFSFVRNRSMPAIARSSLQWRTAVAIAQIVDRAMHASEAAKALFFHARRVSPGWRLTRLTTIGNHVFYR